MGRGFSVLKRVHLDRTPDYGCQLNFRKVRKLYAEIWTGTTNDGPVRTGRGMTAESSKLN